MLLSERAFILCVVLCSVVLSEKKLDSKRQRRHFLTLLGYLHGYKFGQDYALQIPQYVFSPIVIVPSVNQQQSVNIQEANNDENYQESSGTIQSIAPVKITSDVKLSHEDKVEDLRNINDDIEVGFLKKGVMKSNNSKVEKLSLNEQLTLADESNTTLNENGTIVDEIIIVNNASNLTDINGTNKTTAGPYPLANYNNQDIDSLMLTISTPLENSQSLPPISDNRWQNFTLRANISNAMPDENNNVTMINEQQNHQVPLSKQNKTEISEGSNGPYPNAWYNNGAIDQLSITTNYYTNESPSYDNDGWGSYSSMNTLPSGFRPLAGLYYDGFLHTPVKKYGFLPQNL